MPQPPPHVIDQVSRSLRRSRIRITAALVLTLAVAIATLTWWYSLRTANDRLLDEGTLVAATVVDIDRNSRGPDDMTVVFEWDDEELQYSIASHWLQGWNQDIEGGTVGILYDPAHPAFVRLPDQRNYNPFAGPLALLGAGLVLITIASWRRANRARTALTSSNWFPRTVAANKQKRIQHVLIESVPGTLSVLVSSGAKSDLDPGPGWVVCNYRTVVAYHEPSETLMIAGLTKKVAADPFFLATPTT